MVDTSADLVEATHAALRGEGIAPQPADTVLGFVGHGARALVSRAMARGLGVDVSRLEPSRVAAGVDRFLAYYDAHCLDRSAPYPGVAELIADLSGRGVRLSVLTNKPARLTERVLTGTGLRPHFGRVIAGDDRPTRKPNPAGLHELLAGEGTTRSRAILVGDSLVDVETGRNAGVACCAVSWGFEVQSRLRAAGPDWLVDSPRQIAELVAAVVEQRC